MKLKTTVFVMLLLLCSVLIIVNVSDNAKGAVKTWDDGDITGLWNDGNNWNPNGIPAVGDDVVFDATSTNDCSINVNTNSLESFLMDTGYTGTVSLNANTLSVDNTMDVSDFTGTQGTFNAGTGDIIVSDDFDTSSANFVFTRGTSKLDMTGDGTIRLRDQTTNALYDLDCCAAGKETWISTRDAGAYGLVKLGAGSLRSGYRLLLQGIATNPPLQNGAGGRIRADIRYQAANQLIASTTYEDDLYVAPPKDTTATLDGDIAVYNRLYVYPYGADGVCTLDTANFDITITNDLYLGHITWNIYFGAIDSGTSTIDINRDMYIKHSGSYILGDTSTWTLAGDLTSETTSALLDMGTSTFTFDGTAQTIDMNDDAFYNIVTSNSGQKTFVGDFGAYSINVGAGTTFQLGADTPTASRTLTFDDVAGAGFDVNSAGLIRGSGSVANQMYITSAATPPGTYWQCNLDVGNPDFTFDYTTLSYGSRCRSSGTWDIDHSTFDNFFNGQYVVTFMVGATITSFTHNTISNSALGLYARVAHTAYDNIVITMSTTDIRSRDVRSEFINSNFDTSQILLDNTGNVISDVHDDIANDYKIMATALAKSTITNDHTGTDNVELITGTYTMDEDAASNNFWIQNGAILQLNAFTWTVTGAANVTNYGSLLSSGQITRSADWYIVYEDYTQTGEIWLNDSDMEYADIIISFNYSIGASNYGRVDELNITEPAGADINVNITQRDFSAKGSGTVLTFLANNSANVNTHYTVANLTSGLAYTVDINGTTEYTIDAAGGQIGFNYLSEGDRIIEISYTANITVTPPDDEPTNPLLPIQVYTHTEYDMWRNKIRVELRWVQAGGREPANVTDRYIQIFVDGKQIGGYVHLKDNVTFIDPPWNYFDGGLHDVTVVGYVTVHWSTGPTPYSSDPEQTQANNFPRFLLLVLAFLSILFVIVASVVQSRRTKETQKIHG